jgi:hypothetical protein
VSTKAKIRTDAGADMDRLIDEALTRATRQATQGPPDLRAGRYEPELAGRFEAGRSKPAGH